MLQRCQGTEVIRNTITVAKKDNIIIANSCNLNKLCNLRVMRSSKTVSQPPIDWRVKIKELENRVLINQLKLLPNTLMP